MTRSLRSRLTASTALATTAVLVASGFAVYASVKGALLEEFDRSLEARAHGVASLFEHEFGELEIDLGDRLPEEFLTGDEPEYFQVWIAGGKSVARSPSLGSVDLVRIAGTTDVPVFRTHELPDGRAGRVCGLTFTPHDDFDPEDEEDRADALRRFGTYPPPEEFLDAAPPSLVMTVARSTAEMDRVLSRIRGLLAAVTLSGAVIASLLQRHLVRRGLLPLQSLGASIGRIQAGDLATRLQFENLPRELSPIVTKLNDLLDRLEQAFVREKSFSSNVAHELRTPLAGLRSNLEVSLSRERSPREYREFLNTCLTVCEELQQMVESLLLLARLDANQLVAKRQRVNLTLMARESWQDFEQVALRRRLHVLWDLANEAMVLVDPEHLRMILRNLFHNAVSHVDSCGSLSVRLANSNGQSRLMLRNSGSQVSHEDADRVFDRFWTGSASREQTGQHSGLGLSMVKRLVELNGGEICVRSESQGDFTVEILFAAAAISPEIRNASSVTTT